MRRAVATVLTALLVSVIALVEPAAALGLSSGDVQQLDSAGRIVEADQSAALDAAIDRANDAGVAVAVVARSLDGDGASDLAEAYNLELDAAGSRFHTVFVVTDNGYGAHSWQASNTEMYLALDDAFEGIASGDLAGGLDAFVATLPTAGVFLPDPDGSTSTDDDIGTASTGAPADAANETDSGGGGIGFGTILLLAALAGGAFLLVRRMGRNRKNRQQAEADLAEDRAEIVEQLRANADRVITLGDRVIASGNDELIELYEQASSSYQAVTEAVETASTAAEVDELDDRIDTAEWQFAVIEAELDGKPRPAPPGHEPEPPTVPNPEAPPGTPATDRQFPTPGPPVQSPRTGRTYPSPGSRRTGSGRSMGGGLGSVLGGILGDIVLGGGLGQSSRRTQRRSGFPSGGGFGFPSSGRQSRPSTRPTNRPSTRGSRSTNRPASRSSGTRFPSPGSGSRRTIGSRRSSRRGASGGRTVRRSNRGSAGRRGRGRSGRSSKGGRSF